MPDEIEIDWEPTKIDPNEWWPVPEDVKNISSWLDLAEFIGKLRKLPKGRHKLENSDLDSYLEALAAHLNDSCSFMLHEGVDINNIPPWQIMAGSLIGAFIYE